VENCFTKDNRHPSMTAALKAIRHRAALFALVVSAISLGGFLGLAQALASQLRHGTMASTSSAPSPDFANCPPDVKHGRELFEDHCADCHGDNAHGGDPLDKGEDGPDIANPPLSDTRIHVVIAKGIQGHMKGFENKLSQQEITDIVRYLRTL
jgi:mono/diheme cytochrome c family protein